MIVCQIVMQDLWKQAYSIVRLRMVQWYASIPFSYGLVNILNCAACCLARFHSAIRQKYAENIFLCVELLTWVLKLFSLRDIMSKVRITASGGEHSSPPFFCQ